MPDLCHLLHDLAKGASLSIFPQLQAARQQLNPAQEHLGTCQVKSASEAQIASAQAQVAAGEASVEHWQEGHDTYRGHRQAIALQGPPWRVEASTPQSAQEVEAQLAAEITALQALLETNGVPVKKRVLDKGRHQLADVAAVIDLWWQEVRQEGHNQIVLTPMWMDGMEAYLLPLLYWEQRVSRTRGRRRKAKLVAALEAARVACETHLCTAELTPEVFAGWQAWAAAHAKTLQRASSAVEGRNGYLSQMHHNHRGLPQRRYKVWSALYHFDCRASDGSTPASRFFRRAFPSLVEEVLGQIDGLPRPRKCQAAMTLSV